MRLVYVTKDLRVTTKRPEGVEVDESQGTWSEKESGYTQHFRIGRVTRNCIRVWGVFDTDNLEQLEAMVRISIIAEEDERYRHMPGRESSI